MTRGKKTSEKTQMTLAQIWASALVGLAIIFSVAEARAATGLNKPVYCRLVDADFNILAEGNLDQDSPRLPDTKNLFLDLKGVSSGAPEQQKPIAARVTNLSWGGPEITRDQFQVAISVDGKRYVSTNRQDLPIVVNFFVNDSLHRLVCFEDIE